MIQVTEWSSFQSYKDRTPPWIRLHRRLLDNYEFQSMSSDSRALLPMIWLLASENDDPTSGRVDLDITRISFRLRQPEKTIKLCLKEMEKSGFISMLQECNESVTDILPRDRGRGETEAEAKTEADIKLEFEDLWKSYPIIKPKGDKQRALKKYTTLRNKGTSHEEIRDGLSRYNTYCTETGSFNKHCTTWLNQDGWKADWEFTTSNNHATPSYTDTLLDIARQVSENG